MQRIDDNMRAGVDAGKKAERLADAAASVGRAGIASDDPEAVRKLKAKLAELEQRRERMKALNALSKKQGMAAAIEAATATERAEIQRNIRFAPGGTDKPFPSFQLTNSNGEVKRLQTRIAELSKLTSTADRELAGTGWRIAEDTQAGRTSITFDGRQPAEVVDPLKRNGWRWARSSGAWVRKRTENAWQDAVRLATTWDPRKSSPPPRASSRPPAAPDTLESFARTLMDVARHNPAVIRYHEDRAFLASVWDHMPPAQRGTLEAFKQRAIEAHRARLIRMSRADLVQAMPPELVERSEARYLSAQFHFVAVDGR